MADQTDEAQQKGNENESDYFNRRMSSMKLERQSFEPHWKELSEKTQPRRGRFFLQDVNKGDKRYQKIINSKATRALRVARSGLHAGVMSPVRPWFELGPTDPGMKQFKPVKIWLDQVRNIINEVFAQSNLYGMSPNLIGEMLLFATGAMIHADDFEDVARFYTQTVGSYVIAQNHRLEVDTFGREFQMTAGQMKGQFGEKNMSAAAINLLRRNEDAWRPVTQFIEPNPDYRPKTAHLYSEHKRWRSIYFEPGNTGMDKSKFLGRGGFDEFPVYVPRWDTTGEDIWGTDCPGMVVLGDNNHLQVEERRKAQAIDKHVNPPMKGPAVLRNVVVSGLPGGMTTYDGDDSKNGLRPAYQISPDIAGLMNDIQAVERRIDDGFFVNLFKPISNMEGIQPRNMYDLTQRNQEALLELGPTLEHIHGEFLGKLIDRTFNQLIRAEGVLPPPPKELQGSPLKVTYISTLAIAQRSMSANGIDRLTTYIGGLKQAQLTDGLAFNADNAIDEMATILGVPPRIVNGPDEIAAQRDKMQKQQQAAHMAEVADTAAGAVKKLSDTRPQDGNGDSVLAKLSKGARGLKS